MINLFRNVIYGAHVKNLSTDLSNNPATPKEDKSKKEQRKERFFTNIFNRYINLVKSYEETFPTAAKLYKTFSRGIKLFKDDGMLLFKAYSKSNSIGLQCLTRRELEILHEMPWNMIRVAPIIIIGTAVPFGAAIFAVGCIFPKKTLSHHFWSDEQKEKFALIDHKKKLKSFKPIMSLLQSKTKEISDSSLQTHFVYILDSLSNGRSLSVEDILKCKPIFQCRPYDIDCLGSSHTSLIIRMHNLHRGWYRKYRLKNFSKHILAIDNAIEREGGVEKLTTEELKWASYFRGLNPGNMKDKELMDWLNKWLEISNKIDASSFSLLLHCPIFLSYNEPTNLLLLK